MKKLVMLFCVISLFNCKNQEKYYSQHSFKGKVKKVVITAYRAQHNNGSILSGELLFQSYFEFDENGKKVDEKIDLSNLESDDFKTTSTKSKYDEQGNWTENIEFDSDNNPYSITKREFEYYPD